MLVLGGRPGEGTAQLAKVGFVAQDTPTYAGLSVGEHLRLGARLNPRWDDALARARIARAAADGVRTSLLPANGLAGLEAAGFDMVGEVLGTIVMQNITLAIASFTDKGNPPTFPRWYGFLNLCVAMLSLPGCVVIAMSTGPLAWDGAFSYYLPGLALIVWMIGTTVVLLKSIKAQEAAESQLAAAS